MSRRGAGVSRDNRRVRRASPRQDGFILLDVLVTLLIIVIGFVVFMSSLGIAGRTAIVRNQKVLAIVERRNADALDRIVVFQSDK